MTTTDLSRLPALVAALAALAAAPAHAQDWAPTDALGTPAPPGAPASHAAPPPHDAPPTYAPNQAAPSQAAPSQPPAAPTAPAHAAPAAPYGAAPYAAQPGYGVTPGTYGYAPPAHRGRRRVIGYRRQERNPPALWGTGLGLFLAGYVFNFAILTPLANAIGDDRSGASEEDAWAWGLVPVVGPMIQLGIEAPHPAIPIVTGLFQLGGLGLFIYGLSTTETRDIPIHEGDPEDPNMIRVGFDAAPRDGGGEIRFTVAHR